MRLSGNEQRNPYLNRREQFRLLSMVAALALVLICMRVAKNPETWKNFFPVESEPAETDSSGKIDYRVVAEQQTDLNPDEFRSKFANTIASESLTTANTTTNSATIANAADEQRSEYIIDPNVLKPVRDNTLGIRHAESKAFYQVLAEADKIDLRDVPAGVIKDTNYTLLMTDSDRYRGQLVKVEGRLKRLAPIPVDKTATSIPALYEAWVFTADSGKNPYRIVCTSIPEGIETAGNIRNNVRIQLVGYFFKREGYAAQGESLSGKLHVAPLILTREFQLVKSRPVSMHTNDLQKYMIAFMVGIAIVIVLTIRSFVLSDRSNNRRQQRSLRDASPDEIAMLAHIDHGRDQLILPPVSDETNTGDEAAK